MNKFTKKMKLTKRILAICLTFCMIMGLVPSGLQLVKPVEASSGVLDKLNSLRAKFPEGYYWNHCVTSGTNDGDSLMKNGDESYQNSVTRVHCSTHNGRASIGQYDCNYFDGGIQCFGFARKVFFDVFGQRVSSLTKRKDVSNIAVGDYVRIDSEANNGHSGVVLSRNGNSITLVECNWSKLGPSYNCIIKWGKQSFNINRVVSFCHATNYDQINNSVSKPTSNKTEQPSLKIAKTQGEMNSKVAASVCSWQTETNWGMFCWIMNPNRSKITQIGMDLYDEAGNLLKHKEETYYTAGNTSPNAYMYYNVNSELGISLQPGTNYKYQFYAYVGGTRYNSEKVTFRTKGELTPAKPQLSISKADYGINENIQINWQKYSNANKFKVRIQGINGTNYDKTINVNNGGATFSSFMLNKQGEYKVEVQALNSTKSSEVATLSSTIKVHPNVDVTFVMDKDGEEVVLKKQNIMWGQSATPPSAPSKEGHTFQNWSGTYQNVKSDTKITATFKRNSYKITFIDEDGTVLKSENVLFGDSIVPPNAPVSKKEGYVFGGWNSSDYENVKKSAIITASYVWENKNLPVIAKATKCEFDSDTNVYKVNINLTNYPDDKTKARVIVALKTSEGKLLTTTESEVINLEKGATSSIDVNVPYEGAASYAEVVVIKDLNLIIPYSANSTVAVSREWSEWTTAKPEGNVSVESRNEYRTSEKMYKTSTAESLSGWTKYNTSGSWGEWGPWSGWTTTAYSGSNSRQVETTQEAYQVQNGTLFNYSHWCYYNGSSLYYTYSQSYAQARGGWYEERGWGAELYLNKNYSGHWGTSTAPIWFNEVSKPNMETRYRTLYRYRDRSLVTTNYFYKWNDWSDWSTTSATPTTDLKVETRTTYRWKANMSDVEDKTGVSRNVAGKVSTDFAGKQATLIVYKHEGPSDSENEYVGQTVIGEDGSYSFTYITKEEPSQKTGDFYIVLAIEGATELIYLDKIVAPKPVYTVNFVDYDGTIIDTQQVEEGKNAELPSNPEREGYVFTGWNSGITNIHDDMEIMAEYEKEKYTVIYVDWEKQEIDFDIYESGSDLAAPVESTREGYSFKGWLDEEGNTVTKVDRNLVLTAEYEINKYSVKFYDANGKLISEQMVPYGENAIIPEVEEIENKIFIGWGTSAYVHVTGDVNAYATYAYIETSKMPEASVKSGSYNSSFNVTLTGDNNATIYYTLDGSMPDENSNKYDGTIEIKQNTVLRYMAVEQNKNVSEVGSQVYLISSSEDTNGALNIKNNELNIKVEDVSPTALSVYCSEKDKKINFYSVDENVATVDENGNVKGKHVGETTIFAITEDLKYADSVKVTVTTDVIEVEYIEIDKYAASMVVGEETTVKAQVYPEIATYQDVLWFSSDSEIATVDSDGTITAMNEGVATISVYSYSGNSYVNCAVEVQSAGLSVSTDEMNLEIGDKYQLQARYDGKEISEGLNWKSSKESVASVDSTGLVSAISEGTTVITCTNSDGEVATAIINVYKKGELPTGSDDTPDVPDDKPDDPDDKPTAVTKLGDADCNSKVDLNDAKLVLKLALGINVSVTEQGKVNADYDSSGKVDLNDAKYTLKDALGIKFTLPAQK